MITQLKMMTIPKKITVSKYIEPLLILGASYVDGDPKPAVSRSHQLGDKSANSFLP